MSELVAIETLCVRVPCAEMARVLTFGMISIAHVQTVIMATVVSSTHAHHLRAWAVRVRCVVRALNARAKKSTRVRSVTKRALKIFVKMAGNVRFLAGI
jgi:hypothetical protein